MVYYVNGSVEKSGNGSKESPFKKIQMAADVAVAGDEIIVAPGIYREYVNPKNAGEEGKPIVYRSEQIKAAHITGAESIKNWEKFEGDVWVTRIKNSFFGDYNPYKTLVSGDWFIAYMIAHTGDVFLNEKSMYEVTSLDSVKKPEVFIPSWDQEFSVYTWYTEQDEKNDETVIYANFQGKNPNEENVEISVRQDCFLPEAEGINYITLSGFKVSKAATQWAPPTAYQDGMIGPHWSKGWVIEDCEVYESKCSGISLGKYLQPQNNNKWSKIVVKDGAQTERECICQAQLEGWSKERIGSHTIRRCEIHDCGQTGIVGHLGGVFSVIEDNHIHHINNMQELGEERMAAQARLHSIAQTWENKEAVQQARRRVESIRHDGTGKEIQQDAFTLVIDDELTLTSLHDVYNAELRKKVTFWLECQKEQEKAEQNLEALRLRYVGAKGEERKKLADRILSEEKKVRELDVTVRQQVKEIRKAYHTK